MIVTVAWATPEVQDVVPVETASGASVAEAVRASGLIARYGLDLSTLRFARSGATVDEDTRLAPGDRVDLVRGLIADPKADRTKRALAKARVKASSGRGSRGIRGNER
jgi:putative ubiquitin-RnfH superfamily antitoxin RatB of RatAB toxin-antitoxin module